MFVFLVYVKGSAVKIHVWKSNTYNSINNNNSYILLKAKPLSKWDFILCFHLSDKKLSI